MEIGKRGVGYLELTYRNHNQIYFVVRLPSNFVILHLQPGLGGIYFFDFPNIIFKLGAASRHVTAAVTRDMLRDILTFTH